MNFECHITFPLKQDLAALRTLRNAPQFEHWRFSAIDGDPVLGPGVHAYFTSHATNYITLYTSMKTFVGALTQDGVNVVREKIELIMYDTKTGEGGAR